MSATATRTKPAPTFDDLVGVKFLDKGRDPAVGLDCIGLVAEVYRRMGRRFPWPEQFGIECYNAETEEIDPVAIARWHECWRPVKRQYGAVCSMRDHHIGVALCCDLVMHARARIGSVVIQKADRLEPLITGWYMPKETA